MCPKCHYPQVTCVCSTIKPFSISTQIHILQHPSEVSKAKNTARLCQLCLPATQLWIGENADDFKDVKRLLETGNSTVLVLYPTSSAINIEHVDMSVLDAERIALVLVDGTWKKAYKMWQLNPWLYQFTTVKLADRTSAYHIRKAPHPNALSTLEALSYSLQAIEPKAPVNTLFDAFNAMQAPFKRFGNTNIQRG